MTGNQDSLKQVMMDRVKQGAGQAQQPAEGFSGDAMTRPGGLIGGMISGGGVVGSPTGRELPNGPVEPGGPMLTEMGGGMNFKLPSENHFKTGLQPPTWPGTPITAGPDIELLKQGNLPMPTMPMSKTPPRMERWETANKMIDGYQNGWSPNPIITRLMGGR